jgi:hypothetical protein
LSHTRKEQAESDCRDGERNPGQKKEERSDNARAAAANRRIGWDGQRRAYFFGGLAGAAVLGVLFDMFGWLLALPASTSRS